MLVILIILFCINPAQARLISQELKPIKYKTNIVPNKELGRTYNRYQGARVLAPKKRSYPFLDQMENLLYPGKDFEKENPGKRLERIEVAVFGDKQKGKIATRISKLRDEVEGWQIANAQVSEMLKPSEEHAYNNGISDKRLAIREKRTRNKVTLPKKTIHNPYSTFPSPQSHSFHKDVHARKRDYDYMNYRLVTPIFQSIGRKAVTEMFRRK